jgi:hypothetical protein
VLPAADAGAWTRALAEVLADPSVLERERRALPERARSAADAAAELEALVAHAELRRRARGRQRAEGARRQSRLNPG